MKYIPHTQADIDQMLQVVGVDTLDDLYGEVPEQLKLKRELDLPSAMSEIEIRNHIEALANQNKLLTIFAGAGSYDHYTPSVIPYIMARSEFSTSYTPYQAEISQGTLQYIFEYQTMMARLTGLDISNASMYDGATATAEAMMMCVASAKKRNKVLIASTFAPRVLDVVTTYAKYHGVDLVKIPQIDGVSDKAFVDEALAQNDVAGVIVAQPNYWGIVEDFTGWADKCHEHKALFVVNAIASTLGVLRTPGEWGADIACGDAQSLGIPVGYGGPYIGYLCTTKALIRKMPGRLVGETVDAAGQRCFVLTMQAREQHIRREKATSNICTAQGYMCLHVAMYLSLMGEQGLREVCQQSYSAAHHLYEKLLETGKFEPCYSAPFFNEFTLKYTAEEGAKAFHKRMAEAGILAGVLVEGEDDKIIFAVTEKRTPEEVERFLSLV